MNTNSRLTLLPVAAIASALLLCACKTTEANYKAAYETTVAHQREKASDDHDGMKIAGVPDPIVTQIGNGISLPITTTWIGRSKEPGVADLDTVGKYNIVIARFRQIFNARQMQSRLQKTGYPEALILKTTDAYFVATATTSIPDSAASCLSKVESDTTLRLRPPYPFVLRAGHLVR